MALFLRCVFILALLGTAALGDEHAKEGPSRAYGVSKDAVSIQPRSVVLGGESGGGAGQDHFGKEEKPRLQPRAPLEAQPGSSCNRTGIETCETANVSCVSADSGDGGVCRGAPLGSSLPETPPSSSSKEDEEEEDEEEDEEEEEDDEDEVEDGDEDEDKDEDENEDCKGKKECKEEGSNCEKSKTDGCKEAVGGADGVGDSEDKDQKSESEVPQHMPKPNVESEVLANGVQHQSPNGNQQGQNNGDSSPSQPQGQKAAGEVPAASEGLENKPAAPESGSSSGAKDAAEEKKENTPSPDPAHDSVANEVPAKDGAGEKEKNENPDEARAGGDGQDGSSNLNEGQHSGQGTAETSGALFREKTSVALLLAILSRFCACKC